jgi:adenylosuccinate synthase
MAIQAALGVVKAYTTRVGNGPLPTEVDGELGTRLRELGQEYGATTGRPRRCGWFDSVVVRYAARVNGLTGLAVTKLDVLDTFDKVAICTAYRVQGERVADFPADIAELDNLQPEYEWHEGWRVSTGSLRRLEDLPAQARAYLARIEELSCVPLRYVSVGTRRDQIIEV